MIRRELFFFMLNGLIAVAIAYGIYSKLIASGLSIEVSNIIAYLSGMTYGFLANKCLAFRDKVAMSSDKLIRYILLHICTLLINVGINSVLFGLLRGYLGDFPIAFLVAISASSLLNFLGLKYWVFKRSEGLLGSRKKHLI